MLNFVKGRRLNFHHGLIKHCILLYSGSRRPRENHSYASTRSPSCYNCTCNPTSESGDLSSDSPPESPGSLNRSSFRDCEEREAEVNADCSPSKVGGVPGSPRDTEKDELEDLLRSKLCLAGKTFLLAVVEESLEGDLCDRIAGGGTFRVLEGGSVIVTSIFLLIINVVYHHHHHHYHHRRRRRRRRR